MEAILHNLKETKAFAERILTELKDKKHTDRGTLLLLHGDLGSGKTTFTQFVGELLGVKDNIQSPTFVIQKNYKTKDSDFKELVHIDAYRIENPEELKKIRIEETLAKPNTLLIIEWPSKGGEVFKNPTLEVTFEFVDENTRKAYASII